MEVQMTCYRDADADADDDLDVGLLFLVMWPSMEKKGRLQVDQCCVVVDVHRQIEAEEDVIVVMINVPHHPRRFGFPDQFGCVGQSEVIVG